MRRLRETDVGFVNDPPLDRRLDHDPAAAVPWMTFEMRSDYAVQVLRGLREALPRTAADVELTELLNRRRAAIARWRRWVYHERRDEGWRTMLPYRSLDLLEAVVDAPDGTGWREAADRLRRELIEAISLSEGLRGSSFPRETLTLRVSRVKSPTLHSFRLFPAERFRIEIATGGPTAGSSCSGPTATTRFTSGNWSRSCSAIARA